MVNKFLKGKRDILIWLFIFVPVLVLLALGSYFYQYEWTKTLRYAILSAALILIAMIDIMEKKIPNKAILALLLIRMLILGIELLLYTDIRGELLMSVFVGLVMGSGILLLCYAISRGGIGMGDVKLLAVIGAYVGSRSIMSCLLFSMILAAGYSAVMLMRKKLTKKDEIPLGPFVAAGTILTILIGA